ncbi:ATPase family AAA domain-containing protein 5 isoform X1 [Lucilia cuprina]|uniref:ATPase family AAA domain-containing protein 5 isoform X1 n=2 Tax=Lucilia cuprina TaxID=7375 RepID=UPI001F06297F|nr:ATPase family AAA domain-containing protein 5 isoform X1 [Lucilia cuprina]XP_023304606.2 ATPase family AAA domain-containing protein 5 isoform X1 [Lucilia cuprina]
MTELNSYSIENNLNTAESRAETVPASNIKTAVEDSDAVPVVVHYPRLDSKIILQNMEEVLDSVKKQHKEKHRRKKELKKLAMIEAANNGATEHVSSTELDTKDTKKKEHSEKKHKHRDKERRHSKKKPLQEKSTVENGKVLQESPIKSGTILQHFPRTPKKEDQQQQQQSSNQVDDEVQVIVDEEENENKNNEKATTPSKNSKVTNAFEVMMNARNKSIGSNTPGKDSPSPIANKELAVANAKRKLKLQEWAEQKGGAKRKLEEEARAAYVDEQLEQRAKRFKQMLVAGASPKTTTSPTAKTENKTKTSKNKPKENPQKDKPKKRRGPRVRRLSSVDSADSLEPITPIKVDSETSEFLAKLNSPTKKRDSLLGYFPKKESPKELALKEVPQAVENQTAEVERKPNTPKRNAKKATSNHSTPAAANQQTQEDIANDIGTPSGRPRRSCASKARYDYDLENSPTKVAKLAKSTPGRKPAARKVNTPILKVPPEEESIDIIVLDDSTNMSGCGSTTPQGTPKKLAPLFMRSLPKPSPDPEILKARKAFLQSGVPEKLRLEQEKQKQYEQHFEETTEIFPKVSHVKQLDEEELEMDKRIVKCSFRLNSEETIVKTPSPSRRAKAKSIKRQSNVGTLSDCLPVDFQLQKNKSLDFNIDQITLPSLANKRAIIKNWKTEFERFPTYKCYNQMREKYRYFSAIDSAQESEQVSESFVVTRQTRRSLEAQKKKEPDNPDEEYKPPATAPNGELLFSEKYKPLLFEQVLVNLNPVTQLKEFLSNWSNGGTGSARNSQTLDDSMDLNDSNCSNQGPACNTVVLLGPVSSGKTNAVFALANEMNFNVLEINAGMKRTGKRLIQELQEATQSHQIRKDAAGSGSSQKSLLKMSLNGLKSKLKRQNSNSNQLEAQNSDSNSNSDLLQTARKCLILIEDADIVFEQTDAGFTDAIYTLAASSKRPVIVVASNPNCGHLQRLMAQNTIHFSSPNVLNISKFLAVLSLIENCPVQLDDLISLYLYNRRDLRKTLLELQFFIQTGGDRQRQLLDRKSAKKNENGNSNYFASPRKRQFSVEQQDTETSDSNVPNDKTNNNAKASDKVYMHRSLFEYYTVGQNSKWRIPFPIDFHLFNVNLNEIFHVSRKLKTDINQEAGAATKTTTITKRKSKSPKKQWLTTATAKPKTPLDNLCSFYENLSVAALMDEQDNQFHYQEQNKQKPSIVDRLKPNVSETIAHCLLEKAIEVDLEADLCPYNLFDTPKNSISLCEQLGSMQLRSNRALNLDYEPALRSICRSEKIRSTLERRSTRFYHYLRNYSVNVCNFSTTHFDLACEAFQFNENTEENQTINSTPLTISNSNT